MGLESGSKAGLAGPNQKSRGDYVSRAVQVIWDVWNEIASQQ